PAVALGKSGTEPAHVGNSSPQLGVVRRGSLQNLADRFERGALAQKFARLLAQQLEIIREIEIHLWSVTARQRGPSSIRSSCRKGKAARSRRPGRWVGAERHRGPRPMCGGTGQLRRVPHGREPAETGIRLLQKVADVLDLRIRTGKSVLDPTEVPHPVAGLSKGNADVPAAAPADAPRERDHCAEGHEIACGVVEHLHGQRMWLIAAGRLRLRMVEAARGLDERIEASAAAPGAFVAVGGERDIDDARPDLRGFLRPEAERSEAARPISLDEYIGGSQ